MSDRGAPPPTGETGDPRAFCRGAVVALPGVLRAWQRQVASDHAAAAELLARHGSPVNLVDPSLLPTHADELVAVGERLGVEVRVFFARKANKTLALVDTALAADHGVDVSSERELAQVLAAGAEPERVILTAAVKPRSLLESAVRAGVPISVDGADELALLSEVARAAGRRPPVALRLSGEPRTTSRFGESADGWRRLVAAGAVADVDVVGLHVHLHGYAASDRVHALREAIGLVDDLRGRGIPVAWVDAGGGVPMRYLEGPESWERFWAAHRAGLRDGSPLTWEGRGLGLQVHEGEVFGTPAVYPAWQEPVRGAWLHEVLTASSSDGADDTLATALADRGLRLHLEPGRALLDGGGLTVARVEARKQRADGSWLVSLAMNRTQCRSAADDFLVDPLLVPAPGAPRTPAGEGFLVGAYCIEAELLTWRRLSFPAGVAVGDLVVFVNTAGYQMHILESASHQIPLAQNLVPDGSGGWRVDAIDQIFG